jgi:hypothetical protein
MSASTRLHDKHTHPIPETPAPNRREFLYYLGGASLTLLLAGTCGALSQYTQMLPRYGIDLFKIDLETIPKPGESPLFIRDAACWLSNTEHGLLALGSECALHDTSLVAYFENRFICRQCGSQYSKDGTVIWGSAKRNLDRYGLDITTSTGTQSTSADGDPISIDGAIALSLDKRRRISGKPRIR